MLRIVGGTAIALALGSAAFAQYDPGQSRSLNQVQSINRDITVQGQNRASAAQTQFEINSLRGQLSRPAPGPIMPPPGAGPAPIR